MQLLQKIQRSLSTGVLVALIALLVTGLLRYESDFAAYAHRWTAHGLLIFLWIGAPIAIAVRYGEAKGSVWFVLLIVAIVPLVYLAAFTGYLGPESIRQHGGEMLDGELVLEETENRFIVFHKIVLPSIALILTSSWVWLVSQSPRAKTSTK